MFLRTRQAVAATVPKQSALDELLATEREIAAQMAAAERAAESLVSAARAEADAIAHKADEALAAELAQAESRAADAQATLVRTMEEESARLVAKFQTLPDRAIASLADFIVLEATGLGPGKPQ